ncbi:MAG: hypothetical protein M3336_16905 [Chloroflexota bacterium]|nr:hypothetical protein [Chloroflexota bacterium]
MDLQTALAAMREALADADAELTTDLGGQRETTRLRLWQGRVLVDWEADDEAGGCLLHPRLLERLAALHAEISAGHEDLRLRAGGRVLEALTAQHRHLVGRLGGASRVEMRARLYFEQGHYRGGDETYAVVERGRRLELLKVSARVKPRIEGTAPPHRSPEPT